jgi:hypothetical protein
MAVTDHRDTGVASIGSSSCLDSVLQGFAWGQQIREQRNRYGPDYNGSYFSENPVERSSESLGQLAFGACVFKLDG